MADGKKEPTAAEIGAAGEAHAAEWLKSKGYTATVNTRLPGSTDIEADGPASLLVQAKSAVYPNAPADLTPDEERNIKSRASNTKREAWLAKVTMNNDLRLRGEIAWKKLV
ncbi:MAG: hypothetical protein FJX75_20200 [Armatimonadetes bacterium]|nr:hypothetical protein [Armatimonadota bacterium]